MKLKLLLPVLAALLLFSGCFASRASGTRHRSADPSAAEVIRSKDIVSFDCEFRPGAGESGGRPYTRCRFAVEKTDSGCTCTASGEGSGIRQFDVTFDAPADALAQLQAVIDDTGIVSCNGFRGHTDGIPELYGGSIRVVYASGETLSASDNASIPFGSAVEPFCRLFEALADKAGVSWLVPASSEDELHPAALAKQLAGYWVYMGTDREAAEPVVWRFTEEGKVYLSPEKYGEFCSAAEPDFVDCNEWEFRDGDALYRDYDVPQGTAPAEYALTLTDGQHMTLSAPGGRTLVFESIAAPDAADFLAGGKYAGLLAGG